MNSRRPKGAALAETAASLAFLLPIVFTIIFVVLEAGFAYTIKNGLDAAARLAARELAAAYGQSASIDGDRAMQDAQVFDTVRINNIVNDSSQFDDPTFNTASTPGTVTVTVRYLSGQFSLPPFPNPDPLNLGSNFQISATSTYRLE